MLRRRRPDPSSSHEVAHLETVISIEEDLAAHLARGEEVVMATVVRTGGRPPSRPGAKLLLARAAILAGTLGCSEFDAAALAEAPAALDDGAPRLTVYTHDLGTVEVYLEPHSERPLLVVAGATPVAEGVLRGARDVGFRTLLLETRADRLGAREWPADAVHAEIDAVKEALAGAASLYAVITDHDLPTWYRSVR